MRLKVKLLKGGRETEVEVRMMYYLASFTTTSTYAERSPYLVHQIANDSQSVLELKRILAEVYEIPVGEQSVVYKGKALLGR